MSAMRLLKTKKILYLIAALLLAFYVGAIAWTFIFGSSTFAFDFYCESVHRVAVYEETAYILTTDLESNYMVYSSGDFGDTWKRVREVPDGVQNALRYPSPNQPLTEVCDPRDLQHCYRIAPDSNLLEESQDAGNSWIQIKSSFRLKSNSSCQSPAPESLGFIADSKQSALIVVMGTGGIALRSSDDKWTYYPMNDFKELLIVE